MEGNYKPKFWGDAYMDRFPMMRANMPLMQLGGNHYSSNYDNFVMMRTNQPLMQKGGDYNSFVMMRANHPLMQDGGEQPAPSFNKKQDPWAALLAMRYANLGLSELSGISDRNRQDQYMYNQNSTLGQMNSMPVDDYQPNPYSMYMRMGGNLKKYQQGGTPKGFRVDLGQLPIPVKPSPKYNMPFLFGNKGPAAIDSSNYAEVFNAMLNNGEDYVDSRFIAPAQDNFFHASGKDNQQRWLDILATYNNAQKDAQEQIDNPDLRPRSNGAKYFSQKQRNKKQYGGLAHHNMEYQGYTNDAEMDFGTPPRYKQGGNIHIKKENKGKFTASAKRSGMGVQEFARHVLANKDQYSSTQVKRANFARNASKWH